MGRNRKLKGFPQPYSDETFTSWLLRSAMNNRCTLTVDMVECYVADSIRNGVDYDFSFGVGFKKFCLSAGLNYVYCKRFFSGQAEGMILSALSRNSFCRQCLDGDVKFRSTPYWRSSWCRLDTAYCSVHKTLLTSTREDYGLYRSWESFAYFSDFYYECRISKNMYEFTTLNLLGFRVQGWLYNNRAIIECAPGLNRLIGFLLSSFLSLRTDERYCGLARVAFGTALQVPIVHKNYHYSLCMHYGAGTSTSTHRRAALIVLGVVLGFYSERELKLLKNASIFSFFNFPTTALGAGREIMKLLSEPEKEWYASQFISVAPVAGLDVSSRFEEFFSCMKVSRPLSKK
ncbi:hypothetical protein ACLRDI_04345 [Pseudomonas piscis]|uniref:hypothetical protein n=1 Tax=Pseudomonas piscis TaxID=2614538 RepID=UPI0039A72D25